MLYIYKEAGTADPLTTINFSERTMKIGIVGTGNVGCACAMAATLRGSARAIVLVNRTRKTAEAVATDIRYGVPLGRKVDICDGDYGDLRGAEVVLITSGETKRRATRPTAMIRRVALSFSTRMPRSIATSCQRLPMSPHALSYWS